MLFELDSLTFFASKFGLETVKTAKSALKCAEMVHSWLGAKFEQKEIQLSTTPNVPGVTYNFEEIVLESKADRSNQLTEEIHSILKTGGLEPGPAGKLKGKLMLGGSHLFNNIRRALPLAISERQYAR